jgi:hypothetical protein
MQIEYALTIDPAQKICIALSHPGDKNKNVARVGIGFPPISR